MLKQHNDMSHASHGHVVLVFPDLRRGSPLNSAIVLYSNTHAGILGVLCVDSSHEDVSNYLSVDSLFRSGTSEELHAPKENEEKRSKKKIIVDHGNTGTACTSRRRHGTIPGQTQSLRDSRTATRPIGNRCPPGVPYTMQRERSLAWASAI